MTTASSHPAPALAPAIEMINVQVHALAQPDRTLLEAVNWTVAPGDFWAVGGLQGSGKTDFLMLIAGLMNPEKGSYLLFGHKLESGYEQDALAARLEVGLVFDGGQLLHHLTVGENITLPFQYHRNCQLHDCQAMLEILIELTHLEKHWNRYPGEISRNWRLRAGLARALALQPRLLLLDCPLNGLDPREVHWWRQTLQSLSQGHPLMKDHPMTLVVTASDLQPWKNCARQFAILKNRSLLSMEKELAAADHAEGLLQEMMRADSEMD